MDNKKYPAYKPSGVAWLGEIPAGWEVRRLKHVVKINAITLPDNTSQNFALNYVDIGSVSFENGIEKTEAFLFKNSPSRARRKAKEGDTIISTVRTYLKAIDYIQGEKSKYVYSTGFAVLTPIVIQNKFLFHFVRSTSFTQQVMVASKGMSYPAINSTDLSCLILGLPPLPEQTAIAHFLDEQTAKIDRAIAQQQRLIALLKERKQILIQQAVTGKWKMEKGEWRMRGQEEMKDSGVAWIGEVPVGWEVKRLKFLLKERNERSISGEEPLFMVSQVHGLVPRAEYHEKAEVAQSNIGNKIVRENDLVFNKLKAHLGVFFKSTIPYRGIVSPDYAVYYSNGKIADLKYLELLFRHPNYINEFIIRATGIVEGLIRLYSSDLFDIAVPVPNIEEQIRILNFIETQTTKTDRAIALQQQQIERLKEYKAVLIDSAVTGKIKIA